MRWVPSKVLKQKWHYWFAWYPVMIDDQVVWLERVERKIVYIENDISFTYYRFPGEI